MLKSVMFFWMALRVDLVVDCCTFGVKLSAQQSELGSGASSPRFDGLVHFSSSLDGLTTDPLC